MRAKLAFLLLAPAFVAAMSLAAESAKPACAECAKELAPAAPLSGRSVYQVDATWTDDSQRPARLASLRGGPVVLAMFFTSCENACPIIVGEMKRIQGALPAALRGRARFVLVSFDSERDTPAVLRLYRDRMGIGADWLLLRGQPDDVRELAMVLGVKYARDSRGQFAHSNLITVLNCAGEVVFQLVGLNGDVQGAAKAVASAADPGNPDAHR